MLSIHLVHMHGIDGEAKQAINAYRPAIGPQSLIRALDCRTAALSSLRRAESDRRWTAAVGIFVAYCGYGDIVPLTDLPWRSRVFYGLSDGDLPHDGYARTRGVPAALWKESRRSLKPSLAFHRQRQRCTLFEKKRKEKKDRR